MLTSPAQELQRRSTSTSGNCGWESRDSTGDASWRQRAMVRSAGALWQPGLPRAEGGEIQRREFGCVYRPVMSVDTTHAII
jgi:hypothetical protein